ncbi:hypothetical protein PoB_003878400 [Plakobranchus ocellatus]|uniref:Uncharacterized protein n=1 Tax=Plakobranchus ocellatus TaxID=259542 RepID=A0AAV4B0R3_9GAST|nr:hypothetical protein PoB_003878400 [Plakobranchus ocellatus]
MKTSDRSRNLHRALALRIVCLTSQLEDHKKKMRRLIMQVTAVIVLTSKVTELTDNTKGINVTYKVGHRLKGIGGKMVNGAILRSADTFLS